MSNEAEHLEALLAEYVDGQLDAASAKIVEAHLAANPATRAAVEQMKLDRAAIAALPRMNAPADLSEDLRGRLERDLLLNADAITATQPRRFSLPVAALAAMLMLGLGLAGIAYVLLSDRPKPYLATNDGPSTLPATLPSEPTSAEPLSNTITQKDVLGESAPGGGARRDEEASARMRSAKEADLSAFALPGETKSVANQEDASVAAPMPEVSAAAAPASQNPVAIAAPIQVPPIEPAMKVVDEPLPADAAAALDARPIDPARRSLVVVVDSPHALDALAFASRFAGVGENALEVTDAGQQLASRRAARSQAVNATAVTASAELAVVARGLNAKSAASFQDELRRVDAAGATAFEVRPAVLKIESTSRPSGVAMQPRADLEARQERAPVAGAVAAAPTLMPTTLPATQPSLLNGPALIAPGERLRVTLVDPDAFDLRTTHEVTVDKQGNIALPSLDAVAAAGKSPESLREAIVTAYRDAKLMRRPIVKVESIDSGAASVDPNQLIDLYVVVRNPPPATQPTTLPTSTPTTQP